MPSRSRAWPRRTPAVTAPDPSQARPQALPRNLATGQMTVDVSSRPGSVRSLYGSVAGSSEDDDSQEDDEDDEEQEDDRHDACSIRSFERMMGCATRRRRPRKSLSDASQICLDLRGLLGRSKYRCVFDFAHSSFVRVCPLKGS